MNNNEYSKTLREVFNETNNRDYFTFKKKVFKKYDLKEGEDYLVCNTPYEYEYEYPSGKIAKRIRVLEDIKIKEDFYNTLINNYDIVNKTHWNIPNENFKNIQLRRLKEQHVKKLINKKNILSLKEKRLLLENERILNEINRIKNTIKMIDKDILDTNEIIKKLQIINKKDKNNKIGELKEMNSIDLFINNLRDKFISEMSEVIKEILNNEKIQLLKKYFKIKQDLFIFLENCNYMEDFNLKSFDIEKFIFEVNIIILEEEYKFLKVKRHVRDENIIIEYILKGIKANLNDCFNK